MYLHNLVDAITPHPIARRLRPSFDPKKLGADLSGVPDDWWAGHLGPYHNGGWEAVALWAPRGDRSEQRSAGGVFAATEALNKCPYFAEVMNAVPGIKNRVRLMRLQPKGHIHRHSDPLHQVGRDIIRLHVPIITSPQVIFEVHDQRVEMRSGELWHVDVRFPHEVHNAGKTSRVHLVIDVAVNQELETLMRDAQPVSKGYLTGYFARHALPGRVRRALNLSN